MSGIFIIVIIIWTISLHHENNEYIQHIFLCSILNMTNVRFKYINDVIDINNIWHYYKCLCYLNNILNNIMDSSVPII